MIRTIIKRNGEEQEFDPDKINGWGIWAAEELGDLVSWSEVVLSTVSTLPATCPSELLQNRLIQVCLDYNTYSYHLMAGKLYSALMYKEIFPDGVPHLLLQHNGLVSRGRMEVLGFSYDEYETLNKALVHSRDETYAYGSLKQIRLKYALKNKTLGEEYETPQFTFMRMAMSLADEIEEAIELYNHFSLGRINCPTPNYVNLGTPLRGLSSCCVYAVGDSAKSLAIGDHIAYTMTYMSAGIGSHLNTRSIGDAVRNGSIEHQGKLPYYRSLAGAVTAQMQAGRGGACTTYFNLYDPEAPTLIRLKNSKSTETKRIRQLDYSFGANRFFAARAARGEKVFTFNSFTAPVLYDAVYSSDDTEQDFINEYNRLLEDDTFEKNFIDARDLLLDALNEYSETGRMYPHFLTEMNAHTPFNGGKIHSSNLCTEIFLETAPYFKMEDLYSTEDHGRGEVAMCNLAGICPSNIKSEEEYASAAYFSLFMIDKCIHRTHYELPHVGVTTKARMNAGVGIVGLAHCLARAGLKYSSDEGKQFINDTAERHYWHLLNASLRLGKELGNAPWMHKTKWPGGYLPYDTANTAVDDEFSFSLNYDWEGLRDRIEENGGIRNSVLVAHMPTESSSKAVGLPNGLYPIRELALSKTDGNSVIEWVAKDSETLAEFYEIAWDISSKDYTDIYAIIQRWTDQGISADYYQTLVGEDTISSSEVLEDYFYKVKMGLKSNYYLNTRTSEGIELDAEEVECGGGGCTL